MSYNDHFDTDVIRTQIGTTAEKEHTSPLYLTSSFVFDNAEEMRQAFTGEQKRNIYSRFTNPNAEEFIARLAQMERGEAGFATATGMSAVFSTFGALTSAGDHIISCRSIFGSTHSVFTKVLAKWNIETTYVDIGNTENWEEHVQPNTRILYLETPTNPGLDLIDLEWAGQFAKEHGLILVVDNCFATPYLQQPIRFGADLVIHSATKFIDGQGRVMGGATIGKADLIDEIYQFCRATGPAISPFNAWMLSKSLETLSIRMDRHCDSALRLARFLESHPKVESVNYPFLESHAQYEIAQKQMSQGGALVAFKMKGGLSEGAKFLDGLKMGSLTANLGDSKTIVSHPASTTHSKLTEEERLAVGITPNMVRVSVGLENYGDIEKDIEVALSHI